MNRRQFLVSLGFGLFLESLNLNSELTKRIKTRPLKRKLPHIIIIMADDMGMGDLSCYNPDSLIPTPNVDRVAAEGLRFIDAHSPAALCTPTRYSLLTGRYSWRTRLKRGVLMPYEPPLIEPSRLTLASLLRKREYGTYYIGKWHLGLKWTTKDGSKAGNFYTQGNPFQVDENIQWRIDFTKPVEGGPTCLGFDYFFGTAGCSSSDPPYCFIENDELLQVPSRMSKEEWKGLPGFIPGPMAEDWSEEEIDVVFAQQAKKVIDTHLRKNRNRPLFLILSTNSPHVPWLVPDFIKGKSKEGPRGDLVVLVDWVVGEIDAHLKKRGIKEDTLLIVTSDNGARKGANGHKSSLDFRGFKGDIWEGGHRVPFIVRWPGNVEPGGVSNELISLVDLLATFAALISEPLPDNAGEDSWNILPAFFGNPEGKSLHEALVFQDRNGHLAIRQGKWKFIAPNEKMPQGELYDLENDRGEKFDLRAKYPEIANKLKSLLYEYRQRGFSRPLKRKLANSDK